MSLVNWNLFEQLPDSARVNFEMLCRALIRCHYGRYGQFAALANQPGVEFHLRLHAVCAIGEPGRWFGWQCRWYDLPSGRALGQARRRKIKEALVTTERVLPGLTDWVLWTRYPLTKGDQEWFYGLDTGIRLDLWTAAEVEDLLSGDAEILRGTYFGELVLTPSTLATLHEAAVAPIRRRRWLPNVHQTVDAERVLRRMLGETETWDDLRRLADKLEAGATVIDASVSDLTGSLADATAEVAGVARMVGALLADAHTGLGRGDLDLLRQQLATSPGPLESDLAALPRRLRAARERAGLIVTNVVADIRRARTLLAEVDACLGTRLVGVLADAGCGKTQLAAQLTAPVGDRCAGILLYGRDLHAGHNLDDLARHIVIQGMPVPSMEALIAAVDAAGQRAHRRLPIVIDGLNEAEDPRDWKRPLASLQETLHKYPYVLVVCTVRTKEFADEALPPDVDRLEIPDFGHDTLDAIRRYFAHYRINPADAELPIGLLRHPLTLRLYCEVTNPTREREVGIEAMPGSLTSLFDRYLKQAAERIAELAPRTQRYYEQDVRRALDEIGTALWDQRTRGLNESDLRRRLGDEARQWDESIVRALEQEGVILRAPGETPGAILVTAVYDALAGHLVADAILSRHGRIGFEKWVKDPSTVAALAGPLSDRHPLAMDMFRGFVGLVPRRHHRQQLWPLFDEPLRTVALREAAELEGAYLDVATVEGLRPLAAQAHMGLRDLLDRLRLTRGAPAHPLNADFLDTVLRAMGVAERDLRWTEWIRRNSDEVLADLQELENGWCKRRGRSPADRLRAQWVMWTLTSTVRKLRDQATRTLYWFGRGDPDALCDLTIGALAINDPYVPERMLAAAYGTAMALHGDRTGQDFTGRILPGFALRLYQSMFAKGASYSTTHALMRDFSRHTIQLALLHRPTLLNFRQRKRTVPPFRDGGIRKWGRHKGFGHDIEVGYSGPLHLDFANYTLGRLVPDRANYAFKDRQYMGVVANVYWRLVQLGYSPTIFEEIDKAIASRPWGGRSEGNEGRVDRYGKKYSWIAFYELYGLRHDKGFLKSRYGDREERPSDVDIDPSFPSEPHDTQVIAVDWLGDRNQSLSSWVEHGERLDIRPYLVLDELNGVRGPWVLLDGFITQVDKDHERALFAFPRGLLVPKRHSREIPHLLAKQELGKLRLPEIPGDYYTFAGEIPWCKTFPKNGRTDLEVHIGYRMKRIPRNEIRFYRAGRKLNEEEATALLRKMHLAINEEKGDQAILSFLKAEGVTYRAIKTWSKTKEAISKTLPVFLPARHNNWESYHSRVNPGQHAIVPAREIAEAFGLSLSLPAWDMRDVNAKLASISIRWGDPWATGHNLCFLRGDLLDQFLKRERLEFVWAFWGAREIRMATDKCRDQGKKFKHGRKEFQRIYHYHDGQVIAGKASEHYG